MRAQRGRWLARCPGCDYEVDYSTEAAARQALARWEDSTCSGPHEVVWQRWEDGAWRDVDTASSASRQHYIDTGRYLLVGEADQACSTCAKPVGVDTWVSDGETYGACDDCPKVRGAAMRAQVTQLVSDQGTVVVFEAVTDAADIITFACDHRCAQQIAHALAWGEDPIEVNVEPWQILGRV